MGFIDKPIDDVNLDMELELKKLKNIKRKKSGVIIIKRKYMKKSNEKIQEILDDLRYH